MISLKTLLSVLVGATVIALACPAQAVTCTVSGTLKLESQDSYYCDPDILGVSACSGWRWVDLDDITVPLQYMAVGVFSQTGGYLTQTTTDANGNYSATFALLSASQCNGQTVDMRVYFARAYEGDVGSPTPRWRFWITELTNPTPPENPAPNGNLWARTQLKELTGPTSTYDKTWERDDAWDSTRLANVYFTASEYLSRVTTWSSNLDARFTYAPIIGPKLRIGFDSHWSNGGFAGGHDVVWSWNWYALGAALRHELGHITHGYAHNLERDATCETYKFKGVDGRDPRGCEYGPKAVSEGLATFFAVASITSVDTNTKAWYCNCYSDATETNPNRDVCSEKAALASDPDGDTDWFFSCLPSTGTDFWYLGDHRVSLTSNCNRLVLDFTCDCPGGSTWDPAKGWAWCNSTSEGWRNEVQVSRVFWDVLDDNNDSGLDNTHRTRSQFIADLEAMPCAGNLAGVDGSCEEQAIPWMRPSGHPLGACGLAWPACTCAPTSEGSSTPTGTGTRDSYNILDLTDMLPGSMSAERTLNCAQNAPD